MFKQVTHWSVAALTLLLVLVPVAPALAQGDGDVYTDPAGLYSVPVLTDWTVQPGEGYVTLTDPDGEITLHVMAIETADCEEAIATAWEMVEPGFALEADQTLETPSRTGVEQTVAIYYKTDADTLVAGSGERIGNRVYVQLLRGTLTGIERRTSQLQIIGTGMVINELQETDLSTVELLPLEGERLVEFEDYIRATMEQLDAPGVAVAVVQNGQVVYAQGFGVRETDGELVTPDTRMMIGSTTKSMTTLMMGTLVDDGLMAWDTPVVEILPTFSVADPDLTPQINVQHLVCACTGVPRRDLELLFNTNELTAQNVVESLSTFEFFTDFGEAFQYSNQMVATGGYVATLAAGGSYDTLYDDYVAIMHERVFDPLGMTDTTFSFDEVASSGNYAMPYGAALLGDYEPLTLAHEEFVTPIAPAGAVWSTVNDLAKYIMMLLNDGTTPDGTAIISPDSLHHIWEPQIDITADMSYGLGWMIQDYHGQTVISHGGNTLGFSSELAFMPGANLGIAVLTNQQGSLLTEAISYRLIELLFEQEAEYGPQIDYVMEQSDISIVKLKTELTADIDPETLAPYLGSYASEELGTVTVEMRDGGLVMDAGEFVAEVSLYSGDDDPAVDTYMFTNAPIAGLTFHFDMQDGEPVVVLGSGLTEYTLTRVQ